MLTYNTPATFPPDFVNYLPSFDSGFVKQSTVSPLSTSQFYRIQFFCLSGIKFYWEGGQRKRFRHHLLRVE